MDDDKTPFYTWLTEQPATKGGKGSGNFGHAGRPGHEGGSSPKGGGGSGGSTDGNRREAGMHALSDPSHEIGPHTAEDLEKRTLTGGGFTYDTNKHRHLKKGFVSAIYPERGEIYPVKALTEEILQRFADKNRDLLDGDPNARLGSWLNTEDGNVYLDISAVFDTIDEAARVGRQHNQLAIWDLAKMEQTDLEPETKEKKSKKARFVPMVLTRDSQEFIKATLEAAKTITKTTKEESKGE
jgi:hypothetical protein